MASDLITVLHYVGYDADRGGILAVIRGLAAERRFACVLGVNPGFAAGPSSGLARVEFPRVLGDRISPRNFFLSRRAARAVQRWLHAAPGRVFHGHSRAGLLVALWLHAWGERRVLATVHCYGRQRWFYRWAAGRLGERLRWLSPRMASYYGVSAVAWAECLSPCIPSALWRDKVGPRRTGSRVRLGGIGALVPVKEWEVVLLALDLLPKAEIEFAHVGQDDGSAESLRYAADLRRHTLRLGLDARVTWRGATRDIGSFLAEIDCLVVPARREAFSVAALEAGAHGVPVLASDGPGNRDLIEAAKLGWLVGPEIPEVEAWAESLRRLTGSDELRTWRRHEATLRAFLAPTSAARHAEIYRRLLA